MWSNQLGFVRMQRLAVRFSCLKTSKKSYTAASAASLPEPTPVREECIEFDSTISSTEEQRCQEVIATLLKPYYTAQTPVILRRAIAHQKAISLWCDIQYLEDQVGYDTPVQVEIGSSYGEGVMQSTIPFGDYLHYVRLVEQQEQQQNKQQQSDDESSHTASTSTSSNELVYMAQHEMFPILGNDITLPYLCSSEKYGGVGYGKLYHSLLWFGPSGCKSSLHYDPCDNLLMQFVGRKKVILYPPQPGVKLGSGVPKKFLDKDWYYSGQEFGQQYNTSSVDVEYPDLIKYPIFAHAPPAQVSILYPGDVLFIPKKWWHFLRALDTSISVNVWWR